MSAIRLSASVRFPKSLRTVFALLVLVSLTVGFLVLPERFLLRTEANNTTQTLPFSQNWTNTGLITANDNWSLVPGIEGYLGQDITTGTGVSPAGLLGTSSIANDVDVIANQTNPSITNGGVAEFDTLANPTVALQGSGTADAPYLILYLNTTGASNIQVSYNLRDIDATTDNAIQPVAVQYRVGASGNFTNIAAGFVADATTGPSLATLVTPVSVTLPAACNNQTQVQVRIMTTNAVGNDEWVGIDDISVTSSGNPLSGVGAATPSSVNVGASSLLTVTVTPGTNPPSTGIGVSADLSAIGGSATQTFFDNATNGDVTAGDGIFSYSATVAAGTSGGAKSLPFSVTDAEARNASGTIGLTVQAPTNPGGTGTASPNPVAVGSTTLLTFNVTPGTNPTSTGVSVSGNLSDIGGSATQAFTDNGSNSFSYLATVDAGTTGGIKSLPISITDAEGRTGSASISLTVQVPANHLTISQLYGGGGNTLATYKNDYVELYNPTASPISTAGWTIQYASATGTAWTNKQPLGGIIGPGEYYLISLASGGNVGADLPPANIVGEINMSATTGKLALVRNGTTLIGACPTSNANVVDFVGYGSANCREGSANAPAPSNQNAIFRKGSGAIDTDSNSDDFITGLANARITTPIQEIGPSVLSTDPTFAGFNAPKDASIQVDFTEPVTVDTGWYDITCASGQHNDATISSTNSGKSWVITPNVNFVPTEQCTVSVFRTFVHDADTDDSAPDTDMPTEDYVWSFTVSTGLPAPYPPEVHLTMGNPSDAVADTNEPNNYLMEKAGYVLSYNREKGTPNWVSWHLENTWYGILSRVDTFRADPAIPSDWYRVQGFDYGFSGFDRGHMTPNADRDNENRIPINQETYLMTNMVPQSSDNNQGPWADFENYLRTLTDGGNELYIVSGGVGVGGTGSNGFRTTIANGHVTVPAFTWKVVMVIPKGDNDVDRVGAGTRTIAIKIPNVMGIRDTDWTNYLTTVNAVEADTNYDFFENVPDVIENSIEAGTNGSNPPGTADQTVSTMEDNAVLFTLNAVSSSGGSLTATPVTGPSFGGINCVNISCTYTPGSNFNGVDSFSYTVTNGSGTSNVSTVTLNVGAVPDAPSASSSSISQSVQYSDAIQNVTISATDVDSHPLNASTSFTKDGGSPQSGLPANLNLSAANCTAAGLGTSCTWTLSGTTNVAPGSYLVTVTVSDGALQTTTATTVIVTKEDARADYTGALYVSTSSASATTATVTLAATIRDITALCDPSVEPTCDQLAGDIANATVSFVNRDTGTVLASNVPLGYVTAGDLKTATATTNVSLSTGTGDSAQYTIGMIVDGYYVRNSSEDNTVVTVAKPVPGVVSGGGNLLLTDSAGLKAGDDGTKNNFGFNIRNERNGPKGTINILLRRTESDGILHTYQIKGNAMTSLASSVANGTASFNGKGNIQDITFANDPLDPRVIAVDGNASLQVTMTDGGGSDSIAITLWNKTGGLWFASKWNGVRTIEQLLNGGNLQVR